MKRFAPLILLALPTLAPDASAQTWYRARGSVTSHPGTGSGQDLPIALGDTFVLELAFEPDQAPVSQGANSADYRFDLPQDVRRFRVWFEQGFGIETYEPAGLYLDVLDGSPGGATPTDRLDVTVDAEIFHPVIVPPWGVVEGWFELHLSDSTGTWLADPSLPVHIDLDDLDEARLRFVQVTFFASPYEGTLTHLEELVGGPFCEGDWPPAPGDSELVGRGSAVVAQDDLTLEAANLPDQQFALAVVSDGRGPGVPSVAYAGTLCLAAPVTRVLSTAQPVQAGRFVAPLDLTTHPLTGAGSVLPGETLCFQVWCRDPSRPEGSRLTSGLQVTFE